MNRNRVLEETWEVQRYVVEMKGDTGRHLGQFVDDVDDPEWPSCDRDRAQLAAAAPEMARLLLARWQKHAENDAGNDSADWYCMACGKGGTPHAPDCALVAVLVKAGVLPSGDT